LIPEPVDTYPDLGEVLSEFGSGDRIGLLSHAPVASSFDLKRFSAHRTLSDLGDSMEAARNLFTLLRELDQDPFVDLILADLPLDHSGGIYAAIADRLHRASRNKPLS
jgi:hypothetical protein